MKEIERETLLSFWKVQILHHAESQPVFGQWVIRKLRRHGYEVSPGTLYPLLNQMEVRGLIDLDLELKLKLKLKLKVDPEGGPRALKDYSLTKKGQDVLAVLRG